MAPRPYFDPRSGEEITGEEFTRRYTAAAFIHVQHPPTAAETNSVPGLVKYGATCPGCGVGVAREVAPGLGEPCAHCVQQPRFQSPMFNLG